MQCYLITTITTRLFVNIISIWPNRYHVAVTYDEVVIGTIQFYVDGEPDLQL